MSIHKISFKHVYFFSIILLLILAIGETILIFTVRKKDKETFEVVQENGQKTALLDGIYLKSSKYHCCEQPNTSKDAFFECRFINNTNTDITNWKVDIYLVGDARLMSSWNAHASIKDRVISIVPEEKSSSVINAKSTFSFEVYVNYKEHTDYSKIIITGNKLYRLNDFFIHKVIIIAAVMVIAALIAAALVSTSMKREIEVLNRITRRSYAIIDQTMKTFVNFIDAKDEYTKGHSTRVAEYSRLIAKRMGFDEQFQQDMYYMGLMHDIGKITVPDSILNKTGHLTTEEWAVIQLHTENGARLLQNFTVMPEIRDAVLYHHERFDGKGYLNHLAGEEIPLCARIICVADSYDAMSTTRCYRLKYSRERIIQELERCAGKQFDPAIAEIMIDLLKDGTI